VSEHGKIEDAHGMTELIKVAEAQRDELLRANAKLRKEIVDLKAVLTAHGHIGPK